ncbi:hypothetical protein A2886_00330 [candidate division WWE3 bacterium RIFCSPHIGHO2_01_FULL_42_13]|uniref:DUF5673 domain-containing protein n=1 Tax=candidate division WWE3 bacterium RIFCSPHIGHO2_01_FULL_42_13 TaxID=1802617 RepID=A0A1F4US95_UNCKA|nr:MAG: hypothetical protein A2886_00330 [candidate division WWE3 bacterium RIFCSPHIGHO2_01_FULL_42_13]
MATRFTDITDFLGVTNTKEKEPILPVKPSATPESEGERRILFSWDTVSRVGYSDRGNPKLSRTLLIIGVVVAFLLVAMGEFLLIAVVASIIFLRQVLSATPAEAVHHDLTNHGVSYSGEFYSWGEFSNFYLAEDKGVDVLCLNLTNRVPGRLYLLLSSGDREKVKDIVGQYVSMLPEEPKTFFDKVYDFAASRISIDK